MDARPLAATTIPALFLLASLAGGWAFHGRQEASGRVSLHAVARRHADQIEGAYRAQGAQVLLDQVSVQGDVGRVTLVVHVHGQPLAVEALRWQHLPDGRWEGPVVVERDVPSPRRQR